MIYLRNKIVLITGAGFSAPAKLPIQDKILDEMVTDSISDFMGAVPIRESRKFLTAYINIAIYLLKVYGNADTQKLEEKYDVLCDNYRADERVNSVLQYIRKEYSKEADIKNFSLDKFLDNAAQKYIIDTDQYSYSLLEIKEELRKLLQKYKIGISLEDVFTAFDKSISMRENTRDYSYIEMDILQHSLLRLFVYYFANKINKHTYTCQDYENVMLFLEQEKGYVSIITTNWDVLLEQYMYRKGIGFDYNFNSEYVIDEIIKSKAPKGKPKENVKFLKIHGSINWFRCLRCGTLQVCSADECGQYLFDDLKEEKCYKCGQIACGNQVQLKPEIITPTMLKSINSQLYNNLWQNAAYQLQNADKIIFCGYSLPVADFEFRYLLKQNIKQNAKIDVVLYHNDDPAEISEGYGVKSLLPEKRFKDLFSGNECSFFYEGFGDYFNKSISKV